MHQREGRAKKPRLRLTLGKCTWDTQAVWELNVTFSYNGCANSVCLKRHPQIEHPLAFPHTDGQINIHTNFTVNTKVIYNRELKTAKSPYILQLLRHSCKQHISAIGTVIKANSLAICILSCYCWKIPCLSNVIETNRKWHALENVWKYEGHLSIPAYPPSEPCPQHNCLTPYSEVVKSMYLNAVELIWLRGTIGY